ncbi:MAG: N-acetylmuramoyl-L-alanine amidase, partial [Gemmatimonadetes bacterium]|nr:N-acetylmuramoyl-L-alanine amidase [Gemmatimonadota bacterium]
TVALDGISRYSGVFPAEASLSHPGGNAQDGTPALAPGACGGEGGADASDRPLLELTLGSDTVRVPFTACIAVIAPDEVRAAAVDTGRPDSMAVGRLAPGGDQAWEYFWWNRTPLAIDGEVPGYFRVRLADRLHAWISKDDVRLEPEGTPPPRGEVGPTIEMEPTDDGVEIRFHGTDIGPYHIEPSERGISVEFYGASGRPVFIGYGAGAGFLERVGWDEVTDERFRFDVELQERLWGFRHRRDARGRLIVELRRPPRIDPGDPFRGLLIAVDAGHPPGGAIGPTRLREAEVTLAVTRRLVRLLEDRGARVIDVRPDTATLGLFDRVLAVQESGADLSVSVHFNAFPDGVDPFRSNGTAVFYFWPQSVPLARHLQDALVAELGLRDVGVRFQNLAMARIGWLPAVLTESLFMMIPRQEAALRDEAVLQRIAEAHVRGLERFLTAVGREPRRR